MSTHGTKESSRSRAKAEKKEETLWIAVRVDRGIPTEARAFRSARLAMMQEKKWRKGMNFDYDETGVFEVQVGDKVGEYPATGRMG